MVSKKMIDDFWALDSFALVGASRNKTKTGAALFKELIGKGFNVIPVNPHADEIEGKTCYATLADLPEKPQGIISTTNKNATLKMVKSAKENDINNIWFNLGTDSKEALDYCDANDINYIHGKCAFMFVEPVESIHKFHRTLVKFFGAYPK